MASITTILGTDSVSSSRIVLNNNFAALNEELADISALLNTTTQTLILTGLVQGGTLRINNGSDLFKVESNEINANLPIKLNQDVTIGKGLIHSVYYNATTLPAANAYDYTTYVLDAAAPAFDTTVTLADADNGQEITFIANGGTITINQTNILGTSAPVQILDGGSLTLRYIDNLNVFSVTSSSNCTITY